MKEQKNQKGLLEKLDQQQENQTGQENNKNYSSTSTNTKQSGMSAENMTGNAAVLGGAIASAAVIPFVGWIVALAILYSFKDKFKDDPKANKEFENAAKSNGLKDEQLDKLQNEFDAMKKRELDNQATIQDLKVKDYTNSIKEIFSGAEKPSDKNHEEELKQFLNKIDTTIELQEIVKLINKNTNLTEEQKSVISKNIDELLNKKNNEQEIRQQI